MKGWDALGISLIFQCAYTTPLLLSESLHLGGLERSCHHRAKLKQDRKVKQHLEQKLPESTLGVQNCKKYRCAGEHNRAEEELEMPGRGQSAYQMAPSLLVHPSGWPVQSSEDLMDHLWLRAEERGNLPAVLHPEYRRGVNEDSHGQNRQKGHRVEELAAELASEGFILVLCFSCVHQEGATKSPL